MSKLSPATLADFWPKSQPVSHKTKLVSESPLVKGVSGYMTSEKHLFTSYFPRPDSRGLSRFGMEGMKLRYIFKKNCSTHRCDKKINYS